MEQKIPVVVDFENELPVPSEWRDVIFQISEKIRKNENNFEEIKGVAPLYPKDISYIRDSIRNYDMELTPLPNETWETSIYQANGDGWSVMVDLFMTQEGLSDLVLFINVKSIGLEYRYTVESVHVP